MKIFKLMMLALVAMIGLNSCSDDCDHNFIEQDFTQDIVGTWTFLEDDLAEAMVITNFIVQKPITKGGHLTLGGAPFILFGPYVWVFINPNIGHNCLVLSEY